MNQFTLSLHFYSTGDVRNHIDLFLDQDGHSPLETFTQTLDYFRHAPDKTFVMIRKADHRREYLQFQGNINGGRGRVRILKTGKYIKKRKSKQMHFAARVTCRTKVR